MWLRHRAIAAAVTAVATTLGGGCISHAAPEPAPAPRVNDATPPELRAKVEAALADAARRTGLDATALKLVGAERVTWRDGSLGCPEPGMMYSMALVPGYRIRIRAGVRELDYHSSLLGQPSLCPQERATDPAPDNRAI